MQRLYHIYEWLNSPSEYKKYAIMLRTRIYSPEAANYVGFRNKLSGNGQQQRKLIMPNFHSNDITPMITVLADKNSFVPAFDNDLA